MEESSGAWPGGVPHSLWQLEALVPQGQRLFPFVGIQVSWEFVAAFIAGTAVICVFAWRRFSEPSFDVNAPEFRDFKELTIWNLKDSASLRRGHHAIYCVFLVLIYAVLSFFGRMVFQLAAQLNVSGLQINVGTVDFDSWRWPLLLALGIAGFAPLLNALVPVENWLRRFSQEAVGLPTRLRDKSVRIKTLIDGKPLDFHDPKTSEWVKSLLRSRLNASFLLAKNLHEVVGWSYSEHVEWSDAEIRRKLNKYERAVRDDAEAALEEFRYLTDPKKVRDTQVGSDPERQKELERRLLKSIEALEASRDKFSTIMAAYCEHGSTFDNMQEGQLKDALKNGFARMKEKPATGFPLYAFVLVFIAYFLAIWHMWHPPISSIPLNNVSVAVSAAIETLKVFLLVWLPLVVVTAFASVITEDEGQRSEGTSKAVAATMPGTAVALAVAACAMALFAMIYSALPANTTTQWRQALFGSGSGSIWWAAIYYFLPFALVSGICFFFASQVRAAGGNLGFGEWS